jgi:hypothetical protein
MLRVERLGGITKATSPFIWDDQLSKEKLLK